MSPVQCSPGCNYPWLGCAWRPAGTQTSAAWAEGEQPWWGQGGDGEWGGIKLRADTVLSLLGCGQLRLGEDLGSSPAIGHRTSARPSGALPALPAAAGAA